MSSPSGRQATDTLVVFLSRHALVLAEIVVHAEPGCSRGVIPGTGDAGTDVIAQAIRNAERLLVLEQEYSFVSVYRRRTESLDSLARRRGSSESDLASMSRSSYSPGRVIEGKPGKRRPPVVYFTTSDLARPEFRETHCFWYAGTDTLGSEGIRHRVEFVPALQLTTPDWAGTLYLDGAKQTLVRSESRLVHLEGSGYLVHTANCLVAYGEVFPSLVHEVGVDCELQLLRVKEVTWLETWRLLRLHFLRPKPGQP